MALVQEPGEVRRKKGSARRGKGQGFHYAWIIVIVSFLTLLVSASVRTAAGVFIKPFEAEYGWDRGSVSLAIAISLFTFGFGAPLGGNLIDRFGPRRVMLAGLVLIALGLGPMLFMTQLWQLNLLWGLVAGIGTGATAVLGATVANRWFKVHRGVVVGLLGAASATGQLIFLPGLVLIISASGWRSAIAVLAIAAVVMIIPVLLLMRDKPQQLGLRPVGDNGTEVKKAVVEETRAITMKEVVRTRDFWLLAGSFFVCGYTTNGLVGTHLLPHAVEHGFSEVETSGAIAVMGLMNIGGTLISGWLSDRYDNRKLLAGYYTFRAISIAALPLVINMEQMLIFAVFYGLDWIATVPPTVNLTAKRFGRASLGTVYGWIFCCHMIGAGIAAYAGGFFREILGDYHLIFISAALLGFIAAGLSMSIRVKTGAKAAAEVQQAA